MRYRKTRYVNESLADSIPISFSDSYSVNGEVYTIEQKDSQLRVRLTLHVNIGGGHHSSSTKNIQRDFYIDEAEYDNFLKKLERTVVPDLVEWCISQATREKDIDLYLDYRLMR